MDPLSILILMVLGLWFVLALIRVFRRGTCGCGGGKRKKGCKSCASCAGCSKCRQSF